MRAYAHYPSLGPTENLKLCVEPKRRFRVSFYRYGLSHSLEPVETPRLASACGVDEKHGVYQSCANARTVTCVEDWNWPWLEFAPEGSNWTAGVYFALVFEVDERGKPCDDIGVRVMRRDPIQHLDTNSAMFVFTPAEPTAAIAYILPTATYHAYNFTGGGCFYNYPDVAGYPTLTLRRPGGGIGGECREARDPYDDGSPRQCFFHWDAKMLRWLRRNGFAVDCHADLDLDRRDFLTGYRLMVSGGHYEYWSDAMRTRFQRFLDGGGNAAIFGGNTCYRKISLDAAAGSITRENLAWPNSNEAELVGVSYSHGGGWWGDRHNGKWSRMDRPAIGYTAAAPDHWAFDGVDLSTHTTFGAGDRLIGYECDGVVPNVSPANLTVLANALLQGGWNNGNGNSASMVAFPSGRGAVFNAATTDWPRILGDVSGESYGAVSQITYNVVRKLSAARTE